MKTWSRLIELPDYYSRLEYLFLGSKLGARNMEADRYFGERFYRSHEWRQIRKAVLVRDKYCDLAIPGLDIQELPVIHHINPISMRDIELTSPKLFSMENLVACSLATHNRIHYGPLNSEPIIERGPDDHILWKKGEYS